MKPEFKLPHIYSFGQGVYSLRFLCFSIGIRTKYNKEFTLNYHDKKHGYKIIKGLYANN